MSSNLFSEYYVSGIRIRNIMEWNELFGDAISFGFTTTDNVQ